MPVAQRVARGLALLLVGGAAGAAGAVATTTAPAEASSGLLCVGYTGCARAGYSNAGYSQHFHTMYWRMYSGHNCTNYAAYRMVASGLPNTRPWTGSGNAMNWGVANRGITNGTPAVGAVAWYKAYAHPAGSVGHVAYVEKVISPTDIIVSQDSWGGDFSWAHLTKSGGSWPSGFVHFNDVGVTNTKRPKITGTAQVGRTLSTTSGSWRPSGTTSKVQWRANGHNIKGATRSTYTVAARDLGKRISVRATGSKAGMPSASKFSYRTRAVRAGVISSSTAPRLSTTTPAVGTPVTVDPGTWTPADATLSYQWIATGGKIAGATSPTYTPDASVLGKQLKVVVTASRAGYTTASVTTAKTEAVSPGELTVTEAPALTGLPHPGETLRLDTGTASPTPASTQVQWLRNGRAIKAATAHAYQLTTADLGARISAEVVRSRPHYATSRTVAPATRRVRSISTLRVTPRATPGRLAMQVLVSAPGVAKPTGTVRITWLGRVNAELPVRDGVASGTLRGIPAGQRHLYVHYLGSRRTTSVLLREVVRTR